MTFTIRIRSVSTGAATFSAATLMTSAAALAACGASATLAGLSSIVGPPSITATESSTDQALELIRKRREEASAFCPAGSTLSGGNCVPAGAAPAQVAAASPQASAPAQPPVAVTTTTTTGPAPASAAASRPASRPARPAGSSTAQSSSGDGAGYSGGSLKDGAYDVGTPGVVRMTGVWTEGYWDYEKRDNLAPNRTIAPFSVIIGSTVNIPAQTVNQSRKTNSGGFVSGADISKFELGQSIRGFQLGVFGGYNNTSSRLSDIRFQNPGVGVAGGDDGLQTNIVTGDRQEVRGGFGGLYGTVVHGKFSADLAFKVDFFDVERSFVERTIWDPNCTGQGFDRTTLNRDTTSMTNYTVASNANYRIDLNSTYYLEPTVGVRYTYSDFGGNAAALGLKDGDIFRVQGGMRLGTRFITRDGWIWNNSITGLLYSDVAINGYSTGAPGPGGVAALDPRIDEGKLRVMGVLESRVDVGYGTTLYGVGEIRGGDDYIGYGLRGGVRYQW